MKVLFLSGMYPTPAYPQKGIFCHEQVKALKQKGVDVTVVVPVTFYDREVKVKEWEFEGVKINYVKFFKLPGTMDFHKTGKSLYRALKRRLKISEYDVIHADAALPTGQAAMMLAKRYNKKYVIHGHGLDVFLDVSYKDRKTCRKIVKEGVTVYNNADAIIGVSKKVIDNIAERVNIRGKAFVAYNGVNVDRFVPKEHKNDRIILTSIGNLIPLKGHNYTIDALKVLNDKYPNVFKLKLIGRGYLEGDLKDQVKRLGLENVVEFQGYIPYEDVAKELQKTDIFVLPSFYEALGCVYLEAMACGVPSIGCVNNGIDEVIENGKDGYLVQCQNMPEIVKAIEELINEGKRLDMGLAARKKVEEKYTWESSAEAVLTVYKSVLAKQR